MTPRLISQSTSPIDRLIAFCLQNKLIILLFVVFTAVWGILVAPFDWQLGGMPRSPVPVDAIPDLGENQQIVFTEWMGRSPQDVEDQITYPLTVQLLGIPGVRTVRSYSMFGFSTIYVIFKEDVDFYWSRSRILEKLNSLPMGTVPEGVQPALGPDATGMGQIFWYTLEGRDAEGNPNGGWDLDELRSIQDWYVRYALQSADGVAEVASVGGFQREYQIDVDPDAMRTFGVTLPEVFMATRRSNLDVGARTIEVNNVEYVIRGLGFIERLEDVENIVVKASDGVPVYLRNIAHISMGPALRRGALDKAGAEAVGGVVVARYGSNPLQVIKNVKEKIEEISPGLPSRTLDDGSLSKITIVPFYDRTGLIYETLGTLNHAIRDEILITIIVVIVMVLHLRSSLLISGLLPLTVLMTFIAMKIFRVDANIVALSGIAIAIGTIVDMGVVICENILRRLNEADPSKSPLQVVYDAATEVGSAVVTAVATTVVSFLPVFAMIGAEGKLFKPLAYTKTFALIAAIIVSITVIPALAHMLFVRKVHMRPLRVALCIALAVAGLILAIAGHLTDPTILAWSGWILFIIGGWRTVEEFGPAHILRAIRIAFNYLLVLMVAWILSTTWSPLGAGAGELPNFLFVVVLLGSLLLLLYLVMAVYVPVQRWCLRYKIAFLAVPALLVFIGGAIWLGYGRLVSWTPEPFQESAFSRDMTGAFPGLGKEFMPALDEGSFLYMPVTMPHASIGEAMEQMRTIDMAVQAIPEVENIVGKIGRVDSPLDPAPISMIEAVINYIPEYKTDSSGRHLRFQYDEETQQYARDENGKLILDPEGRPYRQWRDEIRNPDDIWDEIVAAAQLPGLTSAPKLQPIAARIVMLQSGMRAPMGVKVKGPDLETIQEAGYRIEELMKNVEGVRPSAVIADRIVGKPYLEIDIDRE